MIEHALALVREGFAVFPCFGKKPIKLLDPRTGLPPAKGFGGFKLATLDENQVRAWWTEYPNANPAIAVPEGCVVVDVDPRNGGSLESLPWLDLSTTLSARSGGGGWHAWFKLDPSLGIPSQIGPGIDVKAGGRSYVMGHGAVHPDTGHAYTWEHRVPIAPAPEGLIRYSHPRNPLTAEQVEADLEDDERTLAPEMAAWIASVIAPHYVQGQMHNVAKALGGWLKQRGFKPADVRAVVSLLPSIDERNALDAAMWAFSSGTDFGWFELKGLLGGDGAPAVVALDSGAPNPKRDQDLAGAAVVQQVIAAMPTQAPPAPVRSVGVVERALRRRDAPPPMPTGLSWFDNATRGGLREEKGLVIGGAPSAGKTSLMRQMADNLTRAGVAVGWIAADEETDGIDVRRIQALGVSRELAERPTDGILTFIRSQLEGLPFEMYDVADGWTIEHATTDLADRYPNMPRVIFGDSYQTVATLRSADLEPRARIDDITRTIKFLSRAQRTRCAWVLTSELSRGAYRSEAQADQLNDMAAFKESGGIEYAGHTLLVLRSIAGTDDTVAASMPKNRVGSKWQGLLRFNRETTNFIETFDDPRENERLEKAGKVIEEVFARVNAAQWPGVTVQDFRQIGFRYQAARDALRILEDQGRIVSVTGPRKTVYYRRPDLQPVSAPPSLDASITSIAYAIG